MRRALWFLFFALAGAGLFLFFANSRDFSVSPAALESVVEKPKPVNPYNDIEPQKPLENPPKIIKAVYATGWSAGSQKKMNYLIDLVKNTEINAIVIDIKDYSGELSYLTNIEEVEKYGKDRDIKITRPNVLIKRLHDEGIYVIARQTVFQDPILANARPDLALTSSSTGKQWADFKGVKWVDSAAKEVWDYNILIAKDALARGFDEINFDYIRFASDGNMRDVKYPFWDKKTSKAEIIRQFFKYLREQLDGAILSADLFGYTTINYDDLGIGQVIENAYLYFDAVAPMVYPSHYNPNFLGFASPAQHPYEVVYASMLEAQNRLNAMKNSTTTEPVRAELRPWLQDFDLGADYDVEKVRAQITATQKANGDKLSGWMLWNPSNIYTRAALMNNEE